ncbi:MAG: hypothetical protein D6802_08905 [Ardenticatenia bacterium]|nr:MAG: hypothetical protein D6802_08905 [Ardenticatenia bacterium]
MRTREPPKRLLLVSLLVLLIFAGGIVYAQQDVTLPWWGIAGGGGRLSNDVFTLNANIGPPVAGRVTGGPFTLTSGFLVFDETGNPLSPYQKTFLPIVVR